MVDCPERKTLDEFKDLYLNKLQAKLCPDQQLPEFDPLAIAGIVFSGLAFMQDGDTHRRFRSLAFISEMCCDDLIPAANEAGIVQGQATVSSGCVSITGNAGAVIPADIEFTGNANVTYVLDNTVSNPIIIGADGTATICLIASEPGTSGNLDPSTIIQTLESYPDIDGEATTDATGFFGGSKAEDCESIRARFIARRQGIQAPGTEEWYIDRVLEYPGAIRACTASCECSSCGGCCQSGYLRMYVLFDGYVDGIAPQGVYDALTASIFGSTSGNGGGLAPLGAQGEFLAPTALPTTVEISTDTPPTPAQLSDITAAISAWYAANLCVGDEYCVSELSAVITSAAPSLCVNSALITGAGIVNAPSDCPTKGQIPCGSLAILDSISFT